MPSSASCRGGSVGTVSPVPPCGATIVPGASEGSGWYPSLTMSFGRLDSVSGRDGGCLCCLTRLLSRIIELKVLYHVVTDKHPLVASTLDWNRPRPSTRQTSLR